MSHLSHHPVRRAVLHCALLTTPIAVGVSACDSGGNPLAASPHDAAAAVSYATASGGKADPNKPLSVKVKDGSKITDVTATDGAGRYIRGRLSSDAKSWTSTAPLAAGAHYTVRVSTEDGGGHPGRKVVTFDTAEAGAGLHVTFGPNAGTYGVGQPLTAELSRPVHDRKARAVVEGGLHVSSTPRAATGSWYWVDDKTLHYRPSTYWPSHATITATSALSGVRVKDGLYGGADKPLTIHTGDRVEAIADAGSDQLTFKDEGKTVRTMPITTGKPGFDTRNGIKVVLEKQQYVQMKSESIGIAAGSSDSYDLPVYWATRVTWSGEYVHAAPWSEGSQGVANVSHGCTGMSTENAEWFFDHVRLGDIVQVINSQGSMMTPFDNGFGDWNLSWAQWQQGSALKNPNGPVPSPNSSVGQGSQTVQAQDTQGTGGADAAGSSDQAGTSDQAPPSDQSGQADQPGQSDTASGAAPAGSPARLRPQAL